MKYSLCTYRPADLGQLTAFMNTHHGPDLFTEGLINEKLEGDPDWNPQQALLAMRGAEIIGFMLGVVRTIRGVKTGYIKLMAVDRTFRRQGIAGEMYAVIEKDFRKMGVEKVRIYDVPLNYYMPGVDPRYTEAVCFLEKLGFQRFGESINMTADLETSNWDTRKQENELQSQGISIERPAANGLDEVLDFVRMEWELWENELRMAFADQPPSIHIARKEGVVRAFAAHNANNKGIGWFGPMGTHPDLRGLGIGSILLKRCLRDMQNMGHRTAIIPWVAPISFYAHFVQAKIDRVFWRFEKELDSR